MLALSADQIEMMQQLHAADIRNRENNHENKEVDSRKAAYFHKLDQEWKEVWEEFDTEFFDGVFTQTVAMIESSWCKEPILLTFPAGMSINRAGYHLFMAYDQYKQYITNQ